MKRICTECRAPFYWKPSARGGRPRERCYDCRPSDAGEPEAEALSPSERSRILFALAFTGPEASEWYPWTDEELERHWQEWAKDWGGYHPGLPGELPWDESTYGFHRFERGLPVGRAIEEMIKADRARTSPTILEIEDRESERRKR